MKRCNLCLPCLSPDCAVCRFCKDMPKHGGKGSFKQPCENRKCLWVEYDRKVNKALSASNSPRNMNSNTSNSHSSGKANSNNKGGTTTGNAASANSNSAGTATKATRGRPARDPSPQQRQSAKNSRASSNASAGAPGGGVVSATLQRTQVQKLSRNWLVNLEFHKLDFSRSFLFLPFSIIEKR